MTFQFLSDVSVSVRETLCALCIAIAQVMRRALSKSPPMPMYLTVRVVYRDRAGGDRSFRPAAAPQLRQCVSCVLPGSKVTGFAPGISEPSFVCKSKSLLTYTGYGRCRRPP